LHVDPFILIYDIQPQKFNGRVENEDLTSRV